MKPLFGRLLFPSPSNVSFPLFFRPVTSFRTLSLVPSILPLSFCALHAERIERPCPVPSLSLSFLLDSGLHFSMLTKLRGTRSPWPGRDRLECLFEASTMRVLLRCTHEIYFFFFFFFSSSSASFRFVHLIRFFLPLEPAVVVQYYRRLVPRRRFLTCANTRICFSIGARAGKTTLSPLCFRSSGQFKHRIAGSPFALLWVNDYRARMEARRDSFARHDCDCVWTVCATWKFKCEER